MADETKAKGKNILKVGAGIVASEVLIAGLAIGAANGKFTPKVVIELDEPKSNDDSIPVIVEEQKITWLTFDENALMYKLDLMKLLTDKYGVSKKTLENEDLKVLIQKVYDYLGEDLYLKDKQSTRIYNLDGQIVSFSVNSNSRWFDIRFDNPDYNVRYNLEIDDKGKTTSISRSIESEPAPLASKKYYIIYNDFDKEFVRGIIFRDEDDTLVSVGIHERTIPVIDMYNINFESNSGSATIHISKEEYDNLRSIFNGYAERDDLESFLIENADLLDGYLDMIKVKNEDFYNELCDLINKRQETSKRLQLN